MGGHISKMHSTKIIVPYAEKKEICHSSIEREHVTDTSPLNFENKKSIRSRQKIGSNDKG